MKWMSRNEEILMLAVYRLKDNAYGVTIREQVSQATGKEWTFGAIYLPLDKLTRKGYILKTMSEPTATRGGRSKCLYTLTEKGKEALKMIREMQQSLWEDIPGIAFD